MLGDGIDLELVITILKLWTHHFLKLEFMVFSKTIILKILELC